MVFNQRLPWLTILLCAICITVHVVIEQLAKPDKLRLLLSTPTLSDAHAFDTSNFYRFVTYPYVHADNSHLINNIFIGAVLGSYIERIHKRNVLFLTVIAAAVLPGLLHVFYRELPAVGFSGIVFAFAGMCVVEMTRPTRASKTGHVFIGLFLLVFVLPVLINDTMMILGSVKSKTAHYIHILGFAVGTLAARTAHMCRLVV